MHLLGIVLTPVAAVVFVTLLLAQHRHVRAEGLRTAAEEVVKKQKQQQYKKITLSEYRQLPYDQQLAHVDSICMRWPDFKAMSPATRMRAIERDPLYWLPEQTGEPAQTGQ